MFASVGLASCATPGGDPTELDAPIFGSSRPTTFIVATEDGFIHARDLARTARILRRYKTLAAAEKALVRSAVSQRLRGLVALEYEKVAPAFQAERRRLAKRPDKAAARRALAALDETIPQDAYDRIAARLARHEFAVPLKTADNVSAVAFARVEAGRIAVESDAWEVDRPLARLGVEGMRIERPTGGAEYATFLQTTAVAVASPAR